MCTRICKMCQCHGKEAYFTWHLRSYSSSAMWRKSRRASRNRDCSARLWPVYVCDMMCVTWPLHMCNVTHACDMCDMTHACNMCDMTHLCVYDLCIFVTWLICTCATRPMHMCDMIHACVTWLITDICDMIQCIRHDACMLHDMTHSHMW